MFLRCWLRALPYRCYSTAARAKTPRLPKTDKLTLLEPPELRNLHDPPKNPEFSAPPDEILADSPENQDQPELRPSWDRGGLTKANALTPLLASMRKLIDANKGCVCLVQVGSFYELYFEQASNVAPKLGIKVALRRTSNYTVPMAGFPTSQLQKFVKILVYDLHYNVAIIDQYPAPADTLMHRKVLRIVTPGTLIDESFLNYAQNNYLVGVYIPPNAKVADPDLPVGISWVDISVGDFYVQETTMGELATDLKRISPSEIVMPREYSPELCADHWITDMADLHRYFVRYHKTTYRDYKLHLPTDTVATRKMLELFSVREEAAMNMVLSYVNVNLPDRKLQLEPPARYITDRYLHMDSRTRDALELTGRLTFDTVSVVGSLLNTIKRTVTPSGTRLLTQWVKLPILDVDELVKRQRFVSLFKAHPMLRLAVRQHLTKMGDFSRSIQRLALKTGSPVTHLQGIGEGLKVCEAIAKELQDQMAHYTETEHQLVSEYLSEFDVPKALADEILDTLPADPVMKVAEDETSVEMYVTDKEKGPVFTVRKTHNKKLMRLHAQLGKIQKEETDLLEQLQREVSELDPKAVVSPREQYAKFMNVIHIACRLKFSELIHKRYQDDIREKRKTLMIYKPRYWEVLQDQKQGVMQGIESEEKLIIEELSAEVLLQVSRIRNCGRCSDLIDITLLFALFAEEIDMVCPKFVKANSLNIKEGRHISVELSLKSNGDMFNANDTKLGSDSMAWVISGPNMGGKSTFLRQNAIIAILAQIGSFVPAQSASLGIVDRIFTRIGASDDIYSDLSTFMVEMVETSNILQNATPRSLAIVDEIGRGTSGKEGLAIAYATLVSLLHHNKCRTLFATHFGQEIKALLDQDKVCQEKLKFFKTKIIEIPKPTGPPEIRFDHILEPGISEQSYALEVARIAGFPEKSLETAQRALEILREK